MDNSGILIRIANALDRAAQKEEKTLAECKIEITINKEDILRDLDEIQKKAEKVSKAIQEMPWYPPVNVPSVWIGDWPDSGTTTVTCTTSGLSTEEE